MSFYPDKVDRRFNCPKNNGFIEDASAEGSGFSFTCGVLVKISLQIEDRTREIIKAKFKTNGCGYAIATADYFTEKIIGQKLTELRGLRELKSACQGELGKFPESRGHCADICFDALYNALADYRSLQVEEWSGEKALICGCFGVAEEAIEKAIADNKLKTVEEVGENCRAGSGCGSCQPLIQQMLDFSIK